MIGTTLETCPSCGSAHFGPMPCGLSWLGRMRSVRLDPRATPSRKRNYFDRAALGSAFDGAKERMLDETKGAGPIRKGPDGRWYGDTAEHDLSYWNGSNAPEVDPDG